VSHELRTPLTAIIGYGELLQAHWPRLDEAARLDHINRMVLSASRQQRMVEDLLLLSRLEAGALVPTVAPVDIASLVERAADEVCTSYRGQRIDLDGPADLQALTDGERTVQILVNLLDNAAKYSSEGSAIQVCWVQEDTRAVVRVCDQGAGISAQGREQLFKRFGRAAGSRTRAGRVGTGLGLFLSRSLVQAMHGTLELESTSPSGSVFCLTLPIASLPLRGTGEVVAGEAAATSHLRRDARPDAATERLEATRDIAERTSSDAGAEAGLQRPPEEDQSENRAPSQQADG